RRYRRHPPRQWPEGPARLPEPRRDEGLLDFRREVPGSGPLKVNAMKDKIDPRMTRARTQVMLQHPFFGTLLYYLKMVETNRVETMAVDGRHLFYNRAYLDTLSPS